MRQSAGKHKIWSKYEIEALRDLYPGAEKSIVLDSLPGRSWDAISGKALKMGLKRYRKARRAVRGREIFKAGKPAWNRGMPRFPNAGRDFEKGHVPWHKKPLYSYNYKTKNGKKTLMFKSDRGWIRAAIHLWERENGPIPEGMVLALRDLDSESIWPEDNMLLSRRDHMIRNMRRGRGLDK